MFTTTDELDVRPEEGSAVMERVEKRNGGKAWVVPEWFVHSLMWVASMWITAVSIASIYSFAKVVVVGVYSEHQGQALEKRVDKVENDLKDALGEVKDAVKTNNAEIRRLYDLLVSQPKENQP